MQVVALHEDGLKRTLRIAISAQAMRESVEAELSKIALNIRLPGFRSGHVPMSVVRERYAASVQQAVAGQMAMESFEQARRRHDLRPALAPTIAVGATSSDGDLEVDLAFEVLPDIAPVDIAALELVRFRCDVDEHDVDRWLASRSTDAGDEAGRIDPDRDREGARQQLLRERDRRVHQSFKRALLDQLLELAAFPVPQCLIERELDLIWRSVEALPAEAREQDIDGEQSENDLRTKLRPIAERRVRLGLMLADIGRRHGMQMTDPALFEERVVQLIASQARIRDQSVAFDDLVRGVHP